MNEVRIYNPDGTLKRIITPEELSQRAINATARKKTDKVVIPPKRVDYTPIKDGTQ